MNLLFYMLGMFVTSTILLIIFIFKYCVVVKKEKKIENDYEKLSKESSDSAIDKSDFFR